MAGISRLLIVRPNLFRAMGRPRDRASAGGRTGRPERQRRTGGGRLIGSAGGREEPAARSVRRRGNKPVTDGFTRPATGPGHGPGSRTRVGRSARRRPERPVEGASNRVTGTRRAKQATLLFRPREQASL